MSTTERGRAAEQIAADYLVGKGFVILDHNWRNRWCELDIVARHHETVHFVEVKYRRNVGYGYAAEYVGHDKIRRLIRAAAAWCQAKPYRGQYQIDVITLEGPLDAPHLEYLPNVISG